MAPREEAHLALLQKLSDMLGAEHAATMMTPYFTVDWTALATKEDLEVVKLELRGELRGEMADLRGELRGEMADLRAEMHRGFAVQSRVFVLSLVMAVVAMTSVFLAAS
jgi:hypothetical protein